MSRVTASRNHNGVATTLKPGVHRAEDRAPWHPISDGAACSPGNVLRLPKVRCVTGLGRSTIYRMEADQQFPPRIKLGMRAVGWLERDVQEWLAHRIQSSRARIKRPLDQRAVTQRVPRASDG
jgi:prophage regulatory protein